MKPGVLIYVQHLLGVGHAKRAARIARALQQEGMQVTLVSGGLPVPGLDTRGVELVQLPPARAQDETFATLLREDGLPVDEEWQARRRAELLDAFRRKQPRVLVTEMFPFGRRQFRFELLPLLEAAAAARPRPWLVSSVRDILVEAKAPERYEEMALVAERFYDLVLVHGDPGLIPFARTFPLAGRISHLLRNTGYVVAEPEGGPASAPERAAGPRDGEVLVSAGSRAGGEPLLKAALEARALTRLAERPWRILAGLNLPDEALGRYQDAAPPGILIERFRPDFPALLAKAALCISQGGYNTTLEALAAGVPAVIAPYGEGRDSEQVLRATLLAERGAAALVPWGELEPRRLARAVDEALERGSAEGLGVRDAGEPININGAAVSARLIGELARLP